MRGIGIGIACLALLTVGAAPPPSPAQPPSQPSATSVVQKLRMQAVTLHVFHRAFENFHDQVDAKLRQEFRIGDTNYTGMVVDFVPDFAMDLKTRKVTTRSNTPSNPAFKIIVKRNGQPQDTTWAFLNMPPHFARKSLVAFLATNVSFENHEPVASRDSLAVRLMQMEGR